MDTRQARALHIAATTALAPSNGRWKVPSQSGNGVYTVTVTSDGSWFCSCPDHDETLAPCKHIMAVETTIAREKREGDVPSYGEGQVRGLRTPRCSPSSWLTTCAF